MQKEQKYDLLLKFLVLGDSGSGKSNILIRFCDDNFTASHLTTIGIDFRIKTIEMDGKMVKLQIWDTAGQERFRTITLSYFRGAMGIVLVYDITSRESFASLGNAIQNIQSYASENVSIILVGNKMDSDERKVEESEGKSLANRLNISFIEASAKNGTNIPEIFSILVKDILQKRNSNEVKLTKELGNQKPIENPEKLGNHKAFEILKKIDSQKAIEIPENKAQEQKIESNVAEDKISAEKASLISLPVKVKLVFIGSSGAGKTSIIFQYSYHSFADVNLPTIGIDFVSKSIEMNGKMIKIQIWDTAGQERYRSLIPSYIKDANGIILTYSLNDRETFESIKIFMELAKNYASETALIVLAGNEKSEQNRVVPENEGKELAESLGIQFMEVNAKNGKNIENLFTMIVKHICENGEKGFSNLVKENAKPLGQIIKVDKDKENNHSNQSTLTKTVTIKLSEEKKNEEKINDKKKFELEDLHALLKKYEIPFIEYKNIQYNKEKKLGEGGFAKVFQGKWLTTDVAVKKYRKVNLGDVDQKLLVENTFSEINIGVKLNHPKINRVYGVSFDENLNIFVVQELAQKSLANLLEDPLTMKRKNDLAMEIAEIVSILKTLQIIHRDLKPQNFLVTFTNNLQVCDFGSIKFLQSNHTSTLSKNESYTATFAPPEVILQDENDRGRIGYFTDIWSLGCILFRLYFGKNLWKGYSEPKITKAFIEKKLPVIAPEGEIPKEIVNLIKKCLCFDEKKRASIEFIYEELKKLNSSSSEMKLINIENQKTEAIAVVDKTRLTKCCKIF